jgi:hypothetical protein
MGTHTMYLNVLLASEMGDHKMSGIHIHLPAESVIHELAHYFEYLEDMSRAGLTASEDDEFQPGEDPGLSHQRNGRWGDFYRRISFVVAAKLGGKTIRVASSTPHEWLAFLKEPLGVEIVEDRADADGAMVADNSGVQAQVRVTAFAPTEKNRLGVSSAAIENPGGISLDADYLDLDIQGDGSASKIVEKQNNWDKIEIQGLRPVVVSIEPLADLAVVLGIKGNEPEAQLTQVR